PAERSEEGDDHAGRRVHRHFDRLVIRFVNQPVELDRGLLSRPISFLAVNVGKHREIVMRRRRQRQPFEGAPVPRIAGDVAPPDGTLWKCASRNRLLWTTKSTGGIASRTPVRPPIMKVMMKPIA